MEDDLRARIQATLRAFDDTLLGEHFALGSRIESIEIEGDRVRVVLELGFPAARYSTALADRLKAAISALPGVSEAKVGLTQAIPSHTAQPGLDAFRGIKNIVAVSSAKGGVGKSTVAANLALALASEGAAVGMLDADIYGPSQPRMLGVRGKPETKDNKTFEPMVSHGIQSMSIGYLIDEEQPMVWRGPMVTQALQQLLNETNWRALDYLIVDMPPGTGDTQLTLSQRVPLAGAVIVTTPQDIATLDARKGLQMFNKVNVPVLGIVENMSLHVCSHCGHEEHIFGSGGGERIAHDYQVPLLGALPLDISIRENADSGHPSVVAEPEGSVAQHYRQIALRMGARLSAIAGGAGTFMPEIVDED